MRSKIRLKQVAKNSIENSIKNYAPLAQGLQRGVLNWIRKNSNSVASASMSLTSFTNLNTITNVCISYVPNIGNVIVKKFEYLDRVAKKFSTRYPTVADDMSVASVFTNYAQFNPGSACSCLGTTAGVYKKFFTAADLFDPNIKFKLKRNNDAVQKIFEKLDKRFKCDPPLSN